MCELRGEKKEAEDVSTIHQAKTQQTTGARGQSGKVGAGADVKIISQGVDRTGTSPEWITRSRDRQKVTNRAETTRTKGGKVLQLDAERLGDGSLKGGARE